MSIFFLISFISMEGRKRLSRLFSAIWKSLGETKCLANNFNAFFVNKTETVSFPLPLTNSLKLNVSYTTTSEALQVFIMINWHLLFQKYSNSTAQSDVMSTRLYEIVLTNSPYYFIALFIFTLQAA